MSDLEKELGLVNLTLAEYVMKNPSAIGLRGVPKTKQTYELLSWVCSNDGMGLQYAAKKLITGELCEIAVKQNGLALQFVPWNIIEECGSEWYIKLCMEALKNDGLALRFISPKQINDEMINTAISSRQCLGDEGYTERSKYPIAFVPVAKQTNALLRKAVKNTPLCIKSISHSRITKAIAKTAVSGDWHAIKYIPINLIDSVIADIAISQNSMAIQFIPNELKDKEFCEKCFAINPASMAYFPTVFITKKMCSEAIEKELVFVFSLNEAERHVKFGSDNKDILTFSDIPEKFRNDKDILNAMMYGCDSASAELLQWNDIVKNAKENGNPYTNKRRNEEIKPLRKKTIEYLKTRTTGRMVVAKRKAVPLEIAISDLGKTTETELPQINQIPDFYELVESDDANEISYDLAEAGTNTQRIYYITDIHIEHQLQECLKEAKEKAADEYSGFIADAIKEKITEMLPKNIGYGDILLIGGDVADSVALSAEFYHELYCQWKGGLIISILGNHELWDGTTSGDCDNPDFIPRTVEDIVEDYRCVIGRGKWKTNEARLQLNEEAFRRELYVNSVFLENQLYVLYKDMAPRIVSRELVMAASDEDLRDLLSKCTFIVLGGIGYSGLDPIYNCEIGLYRRTIELIEEDRRRTALFRELYKKILRVAKDKRVIVLTHSPVHDWTSETCNNKWIYINGHTHRNALVMSNDGTTILSDNQIGYAPKKWKLNSFSVERLWYDPFENYTDGVYTITSDQYREFNRGRGIDSNSCAFPGDIIMLKREKMYMFFLETVSSLFLLKGGRRKKLKNEDIQYYFENMPRYSEKVRKLIKPYQTVMLQLSEEIKRIGGTGRIHGCIVDINYWNHVYVNPYDGTLTPYWASDMVHKKPYFSVEELLKDKEQRLLRRFHEEAKKKTIPMIGAQATASPIKFERAKLPEWVLETEMYDPSRVMKSIQYVWEQNVIRIWNDDILENDMKQNDKPLLEG